MRGFPLFHRPRSCRWLKRLLADIAAKQVEVVVLVVVLKACVTESLKRVAYRFDGWLCTHSRAIRCASAI